MRESRSRCDTFVITDHKLSLYAKVPPRSNNNGHIIGEEENQRCCHIIAWTYTIAILETVAILSTLVLTAVEYCTNFLHFGLPSLVGSLVGCFLGAAAIGSLLAGLRKKKYMFLVPHMVCQILSIVGAAVAVVIFGVRAGTDRWRWEVDSARHGRKDKIDKEELTYDYAVTVIVLCAAGLVTQVWFYAQVSKCYRYLRSKKIRRMHLVRDTA